MNRHAPDALDALARDYVLGTLGPAARRRFEALLAANSAAQDALAAWQARVAALAAQVPPVQPSAGLRARLEAQLFGNDAAAPDAQGGKGTAGHEG